MSKKQSGSSKKLRNSKKSKDSKSKPKKEKIKTRQKVSIKLNVVKSKVKKQLSRFYETIVHQERQFVDGQEPPPSYSFKKRFYGLYVIFIAY